METNTKDLQLQIETLTKRLSELEVLFNKNRFSNLSVSDVPVQFKQPNIYPKDETSIATSTVNSTGRIAIKDEYGTVRYIPYF